MRDFYEQLKMILETKGLNAFKVSEIRHELQLPPRTMYHYMSILLAYDYVHIIGGKQRTGYEYEILNASSKQGLLQGIETHIETVLTRILKPSAKKDKTSKA